MPGPGLVGGLLAVYLLVVLALILLLLIVRQFFIRMSLETLIRVALSAPFFLGFFALIIFLAYEQIMRPMAVRGRFHLEGDYVINRELFSGANADWQYNHYKLRIEDDRLYLMVLGGGEVIKAYSRPIYYTKKGKHIFFELYDYSVFSKAARKEISRRINHTIPNTTVGKPNALNRADSAALRQHESNSLYVDSLWQKVYPALFAHNRDSTINSVSHHMLKQNPLLHADPFEFNVVLRSTKYGNMFFTKGEWRPLQ